MSIECTRDAIIRVCKGADNRVDDLEKVAKACHVTPKGLANIWPFSVIGVKRTTCSQLWAVDTESLLRQGLDKHMLQQLESITSHPTVQSTDCYDGYIENGVFALLFLLKRNHKECVILPNFNKTIQRILKYKDMTLERLDWSHISILWKNQQLTLPGHSVSGFIEKACMCLSKNKGRFLLSLITIVSDDNLHHANILLYDKVTGLLERFDPYQSQLKEFHTVELDCHLTKLFKKIVGKNFKRFISPVELPLDIRIGLQHKQEEEQQQTSEESGFCQPWTIMYADTRMSLPNQDPLSIPELFEILAKDKSLSLTQFIRNYAQNLLEVNNKVYMTYWLKHPELYDYLDTRLPMYALFLEQLMEYAAVYT